MRTHKLQSNCINSVILIDLIYLDFTNPPAQYLELANNNNNSNKKSNNNNNNNNNNNYNNNNNNSNNNKLENTTTTNNNNDNNSNNNNDNNNNKNNMVYLAGQCHLLLAMAPTLPQWPQLFSVCLSICKLSIFEVLP